MVPKDSIRLLYSLFRRELCDLYPPQESDQILSILFEASLGWSKAKIHSKMDSVLPEKEIAYFLHALLQLKSGKPVQYITGMVEFSGVYIKVAPGVLIPRPETEELADLIYKDYRHLEFSEFSLLDIGTGSGCIAVSLAKRFEGLTVTGTDISPEALGIAEENASTNEAAVSFIKADILDKSSWTQFGTFDIIVSNPPYIPETDKKMMAVNVLEYEPHTALFVPDDDPLKFYRQIGLFGIHHLAKPGTLYLEIHERFGNEVKELLQSMGYERVLVIKDIHEKDRFVKAEIKLPMEDQSYWHVEH